MTLPSLQWQVKGPSLLLMDGGLCLSLQRMGKYIRTKKYSSTATLEISKAPKLINSPPFTFSYIIFPFLSRRYAEQVMHKIGDCHWFWF